MRRSIVSIAVTALCAGALLVPAPPVAAAGPDHTVMPSEVPASGTPDFSSGRVNAITQVGPTMIAGGTFDGVTPPGGSQRGATGIAAFDANTGQLVDGFMTTLNGNVEEVLPGPDPGTVYVAGSFTRVNGAAQSHITLLDVASGQVVDGFRPASTNGGIDTITTAQGRLLVGGSFTTAGGETHRGLASFHPRTGDLDSLMGIDVTGHHNDTGSGAQGAVGVRDMEATSDGTRLAVIGNFKQADGLPRDQVMVVDLTSTSATIDADWRTRRYEPYCYSWAFDTYVRGLAVSPDDDFFVVTTTGGGNPGTLCDSVARFEFDASGDAVQPTWSSAAGGDTLWGVEVTENAVYVGGHQRWMNNSEGRDSNGQGSVPRAGLSAHDPDSGVPLAWNPGRNPRGVAAYAIYATSTGLWVGSNTTWIGNRRYRRERLAFFPLAGGAAPHAETTPGLPGDVYLGGARAVDQGNVLYRVNAGGPAVDAIDGGPTWEADQGGTSPYRNAGSNTAGYASGAGRDATVPASAPDALFDTERWSPSDDPRMAWDFPTDVGVPLQVRLYFANRCTCTNDPGERLFDVAVEGETLLDDFDVVVAAGGDQRGTMRAVDLTSDGNVDIDFSHVLENPLVNGIEIVRRDLPPPATAENALLTVDFDGTTPGDPESVSPRGIDWNGVRGAFVVGGTLFTAETDGYLHRRTFSADATGADQRVDPYNDPEWSDVDTGSGNTYRGRVPDLYGQLSSLTGLTYDADRIYYTRSGDSQLYWRWFNADSGIVGSETFTANGGRSWADTGGLFVDGGTLYVVSRSTGDLLGVPFADGPTGAAQPVDDTVDWRASAVFLGPSSNIPPPPVNQAPTAAFTVDCEALTCTVDGTGSSDPDDDDLTYAWGFGDGDTASGATAQHTYDAAGPWTITLEVVDGTGASDQATEQVTVAADPPPTSEIDHVASAARTGNSKAPWIQVPAGVTPGSQLVLVASYQGTALPATPAGWTRVATETTTGMNSVVWTRAATAADADARVTTPLASRRKFALTVTAYSGVDAASPIAAIASGADSSTRQHLSPTIQAPAGAWVLQTWTDKSTTGDWTPPSGVTVRQEVLGSGSGSISSLAVDSGGPVAAGPAGGLTATTDVASGKGISWTLALRPS